MNQPTGTRTHPKMSTDSGQPITVVTLKADNTIGFRIRTYRTYESAVAYLERHLPARRNLDLVDQHNEFVAWEFTATNVGAARAA